MGENLRKSYFWLSRRKECLKSDLIRPTQDFFITRFFLSIGGKGISLSDRCVWGGAVVTVLNLASGFQTFGFHGPIKFK